jgi:hydrogenase maturation factor
MPENLSKAEKNKNLLRMENPGNSRGIYVLVHQGKSIFAIDGKNNSKTKVEKVFSLFHVFLSEMSFSK